MNNLWRLRREGSHLAWYLSPTSSLVSIPAKGTMYSQRAFIHEALGHLGPSQLRGYSCYFSSRQHHSSRPINASKLSLLLYKKTNSGFNRSWPWQMWDSEETIYVERHQKRELLPEAQATVDVLFRVTQRSVGPRWGSTFILCTKAARPQEY